MDKVTIERTTAAGYETKEYSIDEAVNVLNDELENERTIWIDGKPFFGDLVSDEDVKTCRREINVTNRLIGG